MQKYTGRLFPVEIGQLITIVGRSVNNPQRIDVDLLTGNNQGADAGDVQLHLSARFNAVEPIIVRNSHTRGVGWGTEERRDNILPENAPMPLQRGGIFKYSIYIDPCVFYITIDEKPFCTFRHRLPVTGIQRVNVGRDVESVFEVSQIKAQPSPWPIVNTRTFEGFVPAQFNPGNVIVITATPGGNDCGDFVVNLYDGPNRHATHFHLRTYLQNRTIVANSQDEFGAWRHQVNSTPAPFPIVLNRIFKMAVAITTNEFQVAVSGRRILSFPFRDHQQRVLGSLTGIEVISNNGLSVQVHGVDHMKMDPSAVGFENFTN